MEYQSGIYADKIFTGGTILTMDSVCPQAEAVAIYQNRIVAVGNWHTVQRLKGETTKIVTLDHKTMLPGFIDSHVHAQFYYDEIIRSVDIRSFPLGNVTTIAEIQDRLKQKTLETPPGEWVLGYRYDDQALQEQRHPTRYDLDQVSTQHPIFLGHRCGHVATCNSLALEIAQISKDTPDPDGGHFVRDSSGEPNGVLQFSPATRAVQQHIPRPSLQEQIDMLPEIYERMLQTGITSCSEALLGYQGQEELLVYQRAALEKKIPLRVNMMIWYETLLGKDLQQHCFITGLGDSWLRLGPAKFLLDGSVPGFTGWMTQPYFTACQGDSQHRGQSAMNLDTFYQAVLQCHRNHIQIAVHAGGDAAIDTCLDAIERAQQLYPHADARHRIEHCHTVRPDQLERMAQLGVTPSFFVYHTYYWGDRYQELVLGSERAAKIDPLKTALDKGVRFTLHSDAPHVPANPLNDIFAAVNRITAKGASIGPEEAISVEQALQAMTIHAAWQTFEEHEKGSITQGKLADFVILDQNPLDCPSLQLNKIQVLETIIDGKTVYKKQ